MSASDAAVLSSQQRTNTTPSGDSASNSSVIPQSNEFFSSSNATYCDAGDATCAACRVQWIDGYQKDALRSKAKFSCIGGGGCVCTAYCELRSVSVRLPASYSYRQEDCSSTSNATSGSGVNIHTIFSVVAFGLGMLLFAFAVKWGVRGFQEGACEGLNLHIHYLAAH